jgi:hypothetical protein
VDCDKCCGGKIQCNKIGGERERSNERGVCVCVCVCVLWEHSLNMKTFGEVVVKLRLK